MRETMLLIQSIVPGRTIGSPARRSGAAFYVAQGAFLVQGGTVNGAEPHLRLLNAFHESRARP